MTHVLAYVTGRDPFRRPVVAAVRSCDCSRLARVGTLSVAVVVLVVAAVIVAVAAVVVVVLVARSRHGDIHTGRLSRGMKLFTMSAKSARAHAAARAKAAFASEERKRQLAEEAHVKSSAEIVETLGNMKGVMMKFAQILSFAADGLPEELKTQLQTLQNQAPPMDFALVREVLREELGAEPEELFATFEREPTAAASIGQVHRGTLDDGTVVAVKVQYPGVAKAIRSDLDNAAMLTAVGKMIMPGRDMAPFIEELRERVVEEIDYRIEAANQQAFVDLYRDHPFVVIPGVHHDLSTSRVLTMEWIDGFGFREALELPVEDRRDLAEKIWRFVFDSLNRAYMFNGDPHPGNYLFLEDGRVAFLDYGCVKYFDAGHIERLRRFLEVLRDGTPEEFMDVLEEDGFLTRGGRRKVPVDELYPYFKDMWAPTAVDADFEFTQEWVSATTMNPMDQLGPMRYLQPPPGQLFLMRINIGLHAIFAKLGAKMNVYRLSREHVDGDPPSTPLGREVEAWRLRRGLGDVYPTTRAAVGVTDAPR
ncbi:MAG: AarF/ABC1/UbiB kinase family protein [Acidimicrobiia bacterium]